jgi:hypothetical protein
MRAQVPELGDDWGYAAWGPETDVPCWSCGATPTRGLDATRGLYCQRHCVSHAQFSAFAFAAWCVLALGGLVALFVCAIVSATA